jgi:hypothetical protein
VLRALIPTRMPYDGLIIMVFCDGSVHLIIDREGKNGGMMSLTPVIIAGAILRHAATHIRLEKAQDRE